LCSDSLKYISLTELIFVYFITNHCDSRFDERRIS